MSEDRLSGGAERTDPEIERALSAALRIAPLSPDALERIKAVALREWENSLPGSAGEAAVGRLDPGAHRQRRGYRGVWVAAAAVLLTLAGVGSWYLQPQPRGAIFGTVVRSSGTQLDARFGLLRHRAVAAGDPVRVGETLVTPGAGFVALAGGGTLRYGGGTVLRITGAAEATLQRGLIYLDLPAAASRSALRVTTRAGSIDHIGTQFEVLSDDQLIRLRVREGSVRFSSRTESVVAFAGTELTAGQGGGITRRSIPVYGQDWQWAAALAPDYDIEGQPLLGFLEWAGRELGRPVRFSDPHARELAEHTILHGSIRGRDPMDALASVLATTTLTYEIRGDTIWIQSSHGI